MKIKPKGMVVYIVYFVLFFSFFRSELHFPSSFNYTIDLIILILLCWIFTLKDSWKKSKEVIAFVMLFFMYTLFSTSIEGINPVLYAWAIRSNFRFYVFLVLCICLLTVEDYEKVINSFRNVLLVDVGVLSFQFFVLQKRGDYLGGIFGTQSGCNGYSNIFLLLCTTVSVIKYINKKEKIDKLILTIVSCGYIAIMSELKMYFVELIMIVGLALLITKFSVKKLALIIASLLVLVLVAYGIGKLYPVFANSFSFEALWEYASSDSGYTGQGDINRLNAIPQINQRIGTSFDKLIGIGFGNGEYSNSFQFLVSEFYQKNNKWHYVWISYAWIYLELGFIGLIFYEGLFGFIFCLSLKYKKKYNEKRDLLEISAIVSVMAIVLSIYNVSLRMESGYLIYFILAMPFVVKNEISENNTKSLLVNYKIEHDY